MVKPLIVTSMVGSRGPPLISKTGLELFAAHGQPQSGWPVRARLTAVARRQTTGAARSKERDTWLSFDNEEIWTRIF
jgi:hypothetical protein